MPPDPATDGRWRWSLIVLAGLVPFAADMLRNFQLFAPGQLAGSFAAVLGGTTVVYGLCALSIAVLGRRCPALRRRAGAVFAGAAALVFAAFLCDANLTELRQVFGWPRPAALGAVLALFVLYWAVASRLGARKTSLLLLTAAQALRPAVSGDVLPPVFRGMFAWRPVLRLTAALGTTLILAAASASLFLTTRHYARLAQSVRPAQVERRALAEFPARVGPYQLVGDFSLADFERDMLRPADHLIRTYANGEGRELRLTVLYWDPRPADPGARAPAPVPHSPNLCWRYEGWKLVHADPPAAYDWLPGNRIEISQFDKAGQQRLVLYWRSHPEGTPRFFAPDRLGDSVAALIRSWRVPPEAWVTPLYQVRIDTDSDDDPETGRSQALAFARLLAGVLPDYGIGRKNNPAALSPSRLAMLP